MSSLLLTRYPSIEIIKEAEEKLSLMKHEGRLAKEMWNKTIE